MDTIMTNLRTIFTGAMSMANDVITFITADGHELVLCLALLPLAFVGIGVVKRLINIR